MTSGIDGIYSVIINYVEGPKAYNFRLAYQEFVLFEAEYKDIKTGYEEMNEYLENLG